jgi:thiamine pyrophosphokinase
MSRVVIFANGTFDKNIGQWIQPDDVVLCADGGATHALSLELLPQAVIGDFDSLSPESQTLLESMGVDLHRFPCDKNKTDLELTIEHALTLRPSEIILVCATGGRLDQTLSNLLLLSRSEYSHVPMFLRDGQVLGHIVHPANEITISAKPGALLSLVPLRPSVSGTELTGVAWPLNNATLVMGSSWSLSNSFIDSEARLSISAGALLLIVPDSAVID